MIIVQLLTLLLYCVKGLQVTQVASTMQHNASLTCGEGAPATRLLKAWPTVDVTPMAPLLRP
jgi:hypothetical protein